MKKFAWIIALLAALSLGFFSCAEPEGSSYRPARVAAPEPGEETVLFDMQDAANGTITHGIQALTAGDLNFPSSGPTDISPLVKAGNMPDHISSFKAVTVGGKTALQYVTVANWGPGFDLPHSVFGFRAGDKIKITGTATGGTVNLALNVNQGGAQEITGTRATTSPFSIEATLTAADIGKIAGNEQKVIRFEDRTGGMTITITQILITGERPSTITKLAAPTIALSGDTLSWGAVENANGYKIFAGTDLLTTTSALTVNLYSLFGDADKAAGTYAVTVVTGGTAGSYSDSDPSNSVNYTFEPYSYELEVPRDITQLVTHTNPRFVKYPEGWGISGITIAPYNKVTIPAQQQANFAYLYPTGVAGFDAAEWDFVTLDLSTVGTYSAFGYKQYPSNSIDATGRTGSLSSNLVNGTIKLEIRRNPQGLGFQKYSGDVNEFVVQINKATFSKAERYTVRFDANGGSVTPSSTYLVDGTTVGSLLPVPARNGYIFLGWRNSKNNNLVSTTDTVSSTSFSGGVTLTAEWKLARTFAPQSVTFSDSNVLENLNDNSGGNRTVDISIIDTPTAGIGYSFEVTNNGYGNAFAYFTYTFTDGADLSDFNKVTFKFKGLSGDISSKVIAMAVKETSSFPTYIAFDTVDTPLSKQSYSGAGTTEQNVTLTINQGLASAYDGKTLGFAIGIHGGNYEIQITDVVFSQN